MYARIKPPDRRFAVCLAILAILFVFNPGPCAAQDDIPPIDSLIMPPDSLAADSMAADSTAGVYTPDDSVVLDPILYLPGDDTLLVQYYGTPDTSMSKRSPTLTMFKSVAVPGWGQISNGKYLKAGIIILAESYFIYKAIDFGRQASDWRKKWENAPDELKFTYFNTYAGYRDKRNTNLWYTAVIVFLSMFDAYVDAHLQNFPATDRTDIVLDMSDDGRARVELSYRF
jgi:hypothetical protein